MVKRTMMALLALLCAGGLSFAAGTADAGKGAGSALPIPDAANVTARGVFPVVKSPVSLRMAIPKQTKIEDYTTNKYTKLIEDKTGVKFAFEFLPVGTETMQKVMLMFASKDLPDVFAGVSFADATIMDYGSQGLIRPINDLIDAYGVEMQNMWATASDDPKLKATMTFPDGNIYYVPKYSEQTLNTYNHRAYVYTPWLEKLGIKAPTTTDEFYEMLKAFKTKDPNGNGKADEIPLMSSTSGNSTLPSFFINSFIYDDNGNRLMVKDGKVDVTFNKPEFKEALRYLNRLVTEKLIDPLSFTQNEPALKAIVSQNEVLVGVLPQQVKTGVLDRNVPMTSQRSKEYYPILPLKGPKGVQLSHPTPSIPQPMWVITSECKMPATAYRVGDLMLDEEITMTARFGFLGEDREVPSKDVVGFNGQPATYRLIRDVWGMKTQNIHWQWPNAGYMGRKVFDATARDSDPLEYNYVQWISAMGLSKYVPKEVMPAKLSLSMDEMNTFSQIQPTIRTYLNENIAKFIVGDPKAFDDGSWEKFLAEFDKMNLKEFIRIMQSAYDRVNKK